MASSMFGDKGYKLPKLKEHKVKVKVKKEKVKPIKPRKIAKKKRGM